MGNNLEICDKNSVSYSICICSWPLGTEKHLFRPASFDEHTFWESGIEKNCEETWRGNIGGLC